MASYIFCFLFLLTINHQSSLADDLTDVFEFGSNSGKVTFSTSGSIGTWPSDKVTVIPINVPDCSRITYVRVEVRNTLGPPYVKYDDDITSIVIKYRLLQYSISNYVVLAKTKKIKCEKDDKKKRKEGKEGKEGKKGKEGKEGKKKKHHEDEDEDEDDESD